MPGGNLGRRVRIWPRFWPPWSSGLYNPTYLSPRSLQNGVDLSLWRQERACLWYRVCRADQIHLFSLTNGDLLMVLLDVDAVDAWKNENGKMYIRLSWNKRVRCAQGGPKVTQWRLKLDFLLKYVVIWDHDLHKGNFLGIIYYNRFSPLGFFSGWGKREKAMRGGKSLSRVCGCLFPSIVGGTDMDLLLASLLPCCVTCRCW